MSLLNLVLLEETPLEREPYDFIVVDEILSSDALAILNRDYPEIETPANYDVQDLSYGPVFQELLDELAGPAFREAVERKFGLDLNGAQQTVTVRKYSEPSDGNIHTDHWSKILTALFYFNPDWTQDGGKLRILRSADDIEDFAHEVTPVGGRLLVFRRSEKSFHGYKDFKGERRMVQVNWVKSNKLAWYAQRIARFGTHSAKRLARRFQRSILRREVRP